MDINGCHIVATINADSPDGFMAMISRYVGFEKIPYVIPKDAVKVTQGPFFGIQAAVTYAHSWKDANNPPPMPVVESPAVETPVVESTASESATVQVVAPAEQPPVIDQPK